MILEICANSFESALAAQQAGADRVELCTELAVGGLTPSFGLLEKVLVELTIPVHVLIRPRSGNFTYSEAEVDIMLRDIETCKELGCDGVVSGALENNFKIDIEITQQLREASGAMEFTFHRAFDWCPEPQLAIDLLQKNGVTRILSSGQQPTAFKGIKLLKELNDLANGQIQIMPGGGVTLDNCLQFKKAGFEMLHLSATKKVQTLKTQPNVTMHSPTLFKEGIVATSQEDLIKALKNKINSFT